MSCNRKRSLSRVETFEARLAFDDEDTASVIVTPESSGGTEAALSTLVDDPTLVSTVYDAAKEEPRQQFSKEISHIPLSGVQGADWENCPHSCRSLSEPEFEKIKAASPIMRAFEKEWLVKPAFISRICGINCEQIYCNSVLLSFKRGELNCECSARSQHISQYVVPIGMPYALRFSKVHGFIYCTPFYSVVPSLVPEVSPAIFSLHRLTLSRVIKNKVFRHELAFNSDLQIEPPASLVSASTTSPIWGYLESEVSAIWSTPTTCWPVPVLPQILNGLRDLMLSVLPATLRDEILFYLDPERFMEASLVEKLCFFEDFIGFIISVVGACVVSMRKKWVKSMIILLSSGKHDPGLFVAGLKTAIALLNLSKVDQINARLKDRVPFLLETTARVEEAFYESEVHSGRVNLLAFQCWIGDQPNIRDLVSQCPHIMSNQYSSAVLSSALDAAIDLSRLTAGFLWSYLKFSSRSPISEIFILDHVRIVNLQAKYDRYLLECVQDVICKAGLNSRDSQHLFQLCTSKELCHSPIYEVTESRLLAYMAIEIYATLLKLIKGSFSEAFNLSSSISCWIHNVGLNKSILKELTTEISLILYLHWSGAHKFYSIGNS